MAEQGSSGRAGSSAPTAYAGGPRPGSVEFGSTLALLTGAGGILVGATALVPALVTGFAEVTLLVALVSLGVPCGAGLVAGAARLRARRGRGLLLASAVALALVGSTAGLLLASEMSQIMNGVEGSFGQLVPGYLLLVLPAPLATVIAVSRPGVGRWLRSVPSPGDRQAAVPGG